MRLFGFLTMFFVLLMSSCEEENYLEEYVVSKTEKEITVGQIEQIKITAGNGKYTCSSSNSKIAKVNLTNNTVKITALSKGVTEIKIKDVISKEVKIVKVTVFDTLKLDTNSVHLEETKKGYFKIISGSGHYQIKNNNVNVISIDKSNSYIYITAKSKGTATITIQDTKTQQIKTVYVTVIAKIPDLDINKTSVTLEEQQTTTVEITAGSGNYEVSSSDRNKATATLNGTTITIKGKTEGTATITVKDTKTQQTKTAQVSVSKC